MAAKLIDLSTALSDEEEDKTPVCINLTGAIRDHWTANYLTYQAFLRLLGLESRSPKEFSTSQEAGKFIRSIQDGNRHVCWCPAGIHLFTGLYRYFAVRQVGVEWDKGLTDRLEAILDPADKWVAYTVGSYADEEQYRDKLRRTQYPRSNSDFYRRITLPSLVQVTYLIAWLVEQDDMESLTVLAGDRHTPLFFRTSTRLSDDRVVAVSYQLDRRVLIREFPAFNAVPNLKTLDAFLL